jgi:hypothetical protein
VVAFAPDSDGEDSSPLQMGKKGEWGSQETPPLRPLPVLGGGKGGGGNKPKLAPLHAGGAKLQQPMTELVRDTTPTRQVPTTP